MQGAQKWGTEEVVVWLEREGLGALSATAREQGFDGSCLIALYRRQIRNTGPTSLTATTSGSQLEPCKSNSREDLLSS